MTDERDAGRGPDASERPAAEGLKVGLFVDARNPQPWRRPWREHYPRLLDLAAEADRLGADCIWLTEHHGFDDGYLPQPLVLAAAAASRTARARIGTAVLLAPIRDPVHLAEEAALVDLVSGGRLELGLGAGYVPGEFELFGVDMAARFATLDAVFTRVRALLTDGGVTPAPLQRPVPMWLGYGGPVGARRAGRMGASLLTIGRRAAAAYLEGLAEGGHDLASARLAGDVDIVVADDPEAAYERIRPHYLYQLNSYRQAGRLGPPHSEAELGDRLGHGRARVQLNLLVLSPDEAVTEVRRRVAGLPVAHVYTWATVAQMPEDLAARHLELWLGPVRDALSAP
ncbi:MULTISPECIES: LLM class flavin-dependent oxidoreductase [unclassified Pseudofrankia]|uniref:LLM class flavin-dependent oxidoreductase n=1 Tax=unclassified Pseudofrankia TaxID=2994372 RepID=UPI000AD68EFA|nr:MULTISPECIES: LLM class flavin-dependent oxidoreductase [unclassified Pseudofrankia]MDT3440694.1 LLM class flavin-dependent oxidoreductase [Pseudofrankia sp. BMG5.37]